MKVNEQHRELALEAFARWLDDCDVQADRNLASGRAGHIGTFKVRATDDNDEDYSLRIERSVEEDP